MRNYRSYYGRPVRRGYRTRVCEDVNDLDGVPEILTEEWVEANIPAGTTHVDIPYGVQILWNDCFSFRKSIKSVTIPNSVTELRDGCFFDCRSLASITIPRSIRSIGEGCFGSCDSLSDVYYRGEEDDLEYVDIAPYNDPLFDAFWHYNYTNESYHRPTNRHQYRR